MVLYMLRCRVIGAQSKRGQKWALAVERFLCRAPAATILVMGRMIRPPLFHVHYGDFHIYALVPSQVRCPNGLGLSEQSVTPSFTRQHVQGPRRAHQLFFHPHV